MLRRRVFLRNCLSALTLFLITAGTAVHARDAFPDRAIRLVVPYTTAGGTDLVGRLIAKGLSESLGVSVVVDNKPGADGSIGSNIVAKADPDGYTLLIDGTSQAYNVAFGKTLPYDPRKDLVPIIQAANQQVLLLVNARLPIKTVPELIEYARQRPGQLNYGASSNANILPMELFKSMTKTDMVLIPYKGSGPMLTDFISGRVDVAMSGAAAPLPHVKAGTLRVLGIGDDRRSRSLPDFPTVSEAGVPGFQTVQWSGIYAPAGTPKPILDKIYKALKGVISSPEYEQQLIAAGFDPVTGDNTPEAWGKLVYGEMDKWGAIVKSMNLSISK